MVDLLFNLNFDDVHPESSKDGTDCGGDMSRGVFRYIDKLLEEFPDLKITLFVTPDWTDRANDPFLLRNFKRVFGLKYTRAWPEGTFRLDKYPEWCEWLNSYKNIEIAIHGLHHHRDKNPHSAEFEGLSYGECKARLEKALNIFEKSGLRYVKGFRPPGWGVSKGLFKALENLEFSFLSCDPSACGIGVSKYQTSIYKGIVNIPQNWDIAKDSPETGLRILKKYGLLSAKGHIEQEYDGELTGNGLTQRSYENIRALLFKLEKYEVKYVRMQEITAVFGHL